MGNYFYKPQTHETIMGNRVQKLQCHSTRLQSTCSHKELESMNLVSGSLNEAVVSLSNICKSLLDAHVDPITDKCSNYKQIREHIEYSEQCMRKVETMIKEKLRYLDECMAQHIRDKQNVEQQKKEKCLAMDNLKIKKESAEESLSYTKAALEQAERNVETAGYALKVAQEKRNTGEGVAIAGGALLTIPIIGWIVGSVMLSEGIRELNEASNAISAAQKEQQMYESNVQECIRKVYEYKADICWVEREIEKTNEALLRIDTVIKEVQKDLEDGGNTQEMVRRAVTLLSVLSGRVSVLEKQTQRFILWEPVVKTMEEVMNAIVNIAENQLFYSHGIQGLINTLRENVGGLQALCNSPNNSEQDRFY